MSIRWRTELVLVPQAAAPVFTGTPVSFQHMSFLERFPWRRKFPLARGAKSRNSTLLGDGGIAAREETGGVHRVIL